MSRVFLHVSRDYPHDRNFRPPQWLIDENRGHMGMPIDDRQAPAGNPVYRTFDENSHFTEHAKKNYSIAKAIWEGADNLSGLEREVSRELELKLGRRPEGFFVPSFALTRADLSAGTGPTPASGTAGQGFVPLQVEPSLIEVLRPFTFTLAAGATQISNLVGDISIPRMSAANSATWAAENGAIGRTSPTFDAVNPQPHRLGMVTAYSKGLLAQSTIDVDNIVKNDMLKVIAVAVDTAALNGTGAANSQPTGILTVGANTGAPYNNNLRATDVTFGSAATYDSVMRFVGNVEDTSNEDDGTYAYIVSPKIKGRWKAIPLAVNYPKFLWQGRHDVCDGLCRGFASKLMDTHIPGQVLFGKWSDCLVLQWSGVDLVSDEFTLADTYQIRVVIHVLMDVQYRRNLSFCASTDSGAQ